MEVLMAPISVTKFSENIKKVNCGRWSGIVCWVNINECIWMVCVPVHVLMDVFTFRCISILCGSMLSCLTSIYQRLICVGCVKYVNVCFYLPKTLILTSLSLFYIAVHTRRRVWTHSKEIERSDQTPEWTSTITVSPYRAGCEYQ